MKRTDLARAVAALLALPAIAAYAQPPADSAYATDPQNTYVEDATSRGIGQVNMITCIMSALRPDALVNEGPYIALVDQVKCDSQQRASTDNAAAGSQSSMFVTATIVATRESNDEPMRARMWLEDPSDDAEIAVNLSATAPPSSTNPYGEFRLDYCGGEAGDPSCAFHGFLEGTPEGVTYFEIEEGGLYSKALQMTATSTSSGAGSLSANGGSQNEMFAFAYNADYYRRSDAGGDVCFARDARDPDTGMSVWRYGLYDEVTGERVERATGFPIEYTHDGELYQGYLGYWGISLPEVALETLETGSTVEKVEYSNGEDPTRTEYEVVRSGGKLTQYTRQTRTLEEIDQIALTTFVGSEGSSYFPQPFSQYELYWDDADGDFKVTAQMQCGMNGCVSQPLSSELSVPASFWAPRGGIQGYSQSLGGEVFVDLDGVGSTVDSSAVDVSYRQQNLVYPSDIPSTLHCLRDCPTAASMDAFFGSQESSPYQSGTPNNFQPTPGSAVVHYIGDSDEVVVLDGSARPVVIPVDAEALEDFPMFRHGVRSGKLFTNMADAECSLGSGTYCEWKVNELDVYYQWETGVNSHNQFAAVKDDNGDFVTFEAPLQVNFHVPSGATYGQYAEQDIVLQYGGYGNLWGIPGNCVSHETNEEVRCDVQGARYVPSFIIPDDPAVARVTDADHTYLVKWLDREIRFANKPLSVCNVAGLTVPTSMELPTEADLRNPRDPNSPIFVGERPEVSGAARVIHGEVKY